MSNNCQSCGSPNTTEFLGSDTSKAIAFFCSDCFLVQVKKSSSLNKVQEENSELTQKQIVQNSKFVDDLVENLNLNEESFVLEMVTSQSALRQFFKDKNIDCVCAKSSDSSNVEPFGIEQAWAFIGADNPISKGRQPDLVIASNILSHSHDINEVLEAVMLIMKDGGTFIIEDVYLSSIFEFNNRADIAMKSDLWFSTHSLGKACERHGLKIVDAIFIDQPETKIRKMRWTVQHDHMFSVSPNVVGILGDEAELGLDSAQKYLDFSSK